MTRDFAADQSLKMKTYFVYFKFLKLRIWGKRSTKIRSLPMVSKDSVGKRAWLEILFQMQVLKMKEYFVYFEFSKPHSWGKRSARIRRRRDLCLPLN